MAGVTLTQAVNEFPRDLRSMFFEWAGRNGPFWDDNPQEEGDNYFEFEGIDVTYKGLGEAARRIVHDNDAAVFSLTGGSTANFERTPLTVTHGLVESPIRHVDVTNYWQLDALIGSIEAISKDPESWTELIEIARNQCSKLAIGDQCYDGLQSHPFQLNIARRILRLLSILQTLKGWLAVNVTKISLIKQLDNIYCCGNIKVVTLTKHAQGIRKRHHQKPKERQSVVGCRKRQIHGQIFS